jgi:predicted murein hydrolase (TIGR00659 family)
MIIFSFAITILLYFGAKWCYGRSRKIYLSPLVTTPILIVSLLLVAHIPYDTYYGGAKWLSIMLQPATIAFAVPLYKYRAILNKHALEIIVSVLFGSIVAIISSALIAEGLHINTQLVNSLIPRSVTTPIAMDISQMVGGVPSITAVFVILTGLLGSLLGPVVIRLFKIENEIARGVLFGTGAHVVGTTKAFEFSSTTGTISGLSMILAAIITVCAAPLIVLMLRC